MKINKDSTVTINYKLYNAQGEEVESTYGEEPIVYIHGHEEIIVGLEAALEGQAAGAKLTVKLSPEDGYGAHNPEGIFAVPLSELPEGQDFKKGDWISVHVDGDDEEGDEEQHEHSENCDHDHDEGDMEVMIHEIRDDEVILDANHPLAGQSISFEVEVVDVQAG